MDTPSRGARRGTAQRPATATALKATTADEATETPAAVAATDPATTLAELAGEQAAPVVALAAYPLIALTGTALFPAASLSLTITRASALRAIRAAQSGEKLCVVAFLRPDDSLPTGATPDQTDQPGQATSATGDAAETAKAAAGADATSGVVEMAGNATEGAQPPQRTETDESRPGPLIANGQALCEVATLATIKRYELQTDDCVEVTLEGLRRVRVAHWLKDSPYPRVACSEIAEIVSDPAMSKALVRHAHALFEQLAQLSRRYAAEEIAEIKATQGPGQLADLLAGRLAPEAPQQSELLEALDPLERLERICVLMGNEIETLELENKIRQKVRQQVEKNQREYYLKEQLRAIQEELGADQASEARELREKLERKGLPTEALTKLTKEIERLERMPAHSAELVVLRNYIDWALALPWQERTEDLGDMRHAQQTLDAEHYGLDKVKERIIEFLAVRQLRLLRAQREAAQAAEGGDEHSPVATEAVAAGPARSPIHKGPILCLIGPPGVGKTSLGRSIAHALGRKAFRISLGGVHDEAEIRGHRRTYVGALPGRIIQAMKTVGVRNPVIILDEIDKLASDYRGDPSSALLEALDPEQNQSFTDHYLETPYDLSEVFFICTGNNRFQIPRALADRMDIIEIPGYTEEEKIAIGRTFLWEKTLDQCGLAPSQALLSSAVMAYVVTRYTREAGVRNLERALDGICRKLALRIVQQPSAKPAARLRVTEKLVEEFLGPPRYSPDHPFEPGQVGVAMGLAWTTNGGAMLPVEVLTMPGKGGLMITGQLGDVMQESARAAYSYIRSRADDLAIPDSFPNNLHIHIHLPEGAVPKDGPSAGITMAIAMISALTHRPVRNDLAMTGEITLRGRILPIGGLKNKALAAYSVGIRHLLAPAENEKDLAEIPAKIRHDLTITLVATMDDVIRTALLPAATDSTTDSTTEAPVEATRAVTGA